MSRRVVFLCFLLISSSSGLLGRVEAQSPPNNTKEEEFYNAFDKIESLLVLQYDEECNYQDGLKLRETLRQNITESNFEQLTKEMKDLSSSKGFCDTNKALQCKAEGKCGCMTDPEPGIETEAELVEPGKCRLSKGSRCYPDDPERLALSCKSGTKCLLKSDKRSECKCESLK